MAENKRSRGQAAEKLAAEYLQAEGFQIIERNYYTRFGEIDLIAREEPYLVFAEVKYRKSGENGYPEEAVSCSKIRKICSSARVYLMLHQIREDQPVRFDVISILGNDVKLIRNAFDIV